MKKLMLFLFVFTLTGCAMMQTYRVPVNDYYKPLPSYPLKLLVYYQPSIEGNSLLEKESSRYKHGSGGGFGHCVTFLDNQLLETELEQYVRENMYYFRIFHGSFIVKKFNSAFERMFTELKRSYAEEQAARLSEAKSKGVDLLCDVVKDTQEFKFSIRDNFGKRLFKAVITGPFPIKTAYTTSTDVKIKVAFYLPDGSVVSEKTYPYSMAEVLHEYPTNAFKTAAEKANGQFGRGIDEIITQAIEDLGNSETFKELVGSKSQ